MNKSNVLAAAVLLFSVLVCGFVYREYRGLSSYFAPNVSLSDQINREQQMIKQLEEQFRETKTILQNQIASLRQQLSTSTESKPH